MKKIEAIIRPEKFDYVRKALKEIKCDSITVLEVEGHGKQQGVIHQWRGEKYKIELLPKIKVEIVAKDSDVESIVETISKSARTGEIGDGKIFISDVQDVIRIRTKERGIFAI